MAAPCCTMCVDQWETPVEVISQNNKKHPDKKAGGNSISVGGENQNQEPGSTWAEPATIRPTTDPVTSSDGSLIMQRDDRIVVLNNYFRFAYTIGISAFMIKVPKNKFLMNLQKVLFFATTFLTLCNSAELIKTQTFGYTKAGNVFSFVLLALICVDASVRLLYLSVVLRNQNELKALFSAFSNTYTAANSVNVRNAVPVVLAAQSIVDAILRTMYEHFEPVSWSMQSAIYERSVPFQRAIFVWSHARYSNETGSGAPMGADGLAMYQIFFGTFGLLSETVGYIYQNACTHVFAIAAMSLYYATTNLTFSLKSNGILEQVKSTTSLDLDEEKQIWQTYTSLAHLTKHIETSLGLLLTTSHIFYLLLFGNFIWPTLYDDDKGVAYFLFVVRLIPVSFGYFFAIQTARKTESFREWVRQNYYDRDVHINGKVIKTQILLEDLSDHPVGIGNRLFFVNDEFAIKFVGVVASYFVFISDTLAEKD